MRSLKAYRISPAHIPGHKYRICRDCGLDWNVSKYDESGRVYYCPKCRKRRKDNERNN